MNHLFHASSFLMLMILVSGVHSQDLDNFAATKSALRDPIIFTAVGISGFCAVLLVFAVLRLWCGICGSAPIYDDYQYEMENFTTPLNTQLRHKHRESTKRESSHGFTTFATPQTNSTHIMQSEFAEDVQLESRFDEQRGYFGSTQTLDTELSSNGSASSRNSMSFLPGSSLPLSPQSSRRPSEPRQVFLGSTSPGQINPTVGGRSSGTYRPRTKRPHTELL